MSLLGALTVDTGPSGAPRVGAVIGDEWGIAFAQGGVVMAQMLRAAEAVDARPDLRVASATATFLRPVPCGPVSMDVTVLRSGRNGSQVDVDLWAGGGDHATPNAHMVIVSTSVGEHWPVLTGAAMPSILERVGPGGGVRMGVAPDGPTASSFFATTHWHDVPPDPPEALRRYSWFSFGEGHARDQHEEWDPALLPIPADALGMAAVPTVSEQMGLLTSPSLQLMLQFHAPARGPWLGIDSRCLYTGGGIAAGVATLWNADGGIVATATQTAILRSL